MQQPIDDVSGVKLLAGTDHPVFLLQMPDDSGLVIKREESRDPAQLKNNMSLMRAVSGAGAGKVLNPGELTVIDDYLLRCQIYAQSMQQTEDVSVAELRRQRTAPKQAWHKMAEAPGLIDVKQALVQLQAQNKQGVRMISAALNAQGGFETLGRIVAVDLFTGNMDRFDVNEAEGERAACYNPMTKEKFRVMQNLGNVMVSVQKKDRIVLGLDSYDPSSGYNDMSKDIGHLEDNNFSNLAWSGRLLSPKENARLKGFCKDIYADLEEAFGPRNRKFAFLNQKRLDPRGPQRLLTGVEEGRKLVITKVQKLAGKMSAGTNAGLQSRLLIIQS